MPYSSPFIRVVMAGTIYTGERFSCGLSIGQNFDGPLTRPTNIDPYVAACTAWFARSGTRIAGAAKLDEVKVNLVGVNGLYASATESGTAEISPVIAGVGSSSTPAPQLTAALTLTTNRRRGPAARGRIYPPLPVFTLEPDGRMSATMAAEMASSMATLINALNVIGPGDVAIMSKVGNGAIGRVTGVECGRVVDTQRRRRRSLDEGRVPSTVVIPVPTP